MGGKSFFINICMGYSQVPTFFYPPGREARSLYGEMQKTGVNAPRRNCDIFK